MTDLETDVAAWIGDGRTVKTMAGDCIIRMARAVLGDFWKDYPEHETEVESEAVAQLEAMATVVGAENYQRFVGGAMVQSHGGMILELKAT